jgi:protein transport protein SEC20
MGTSKQLITALEKSDWLDRLLIMTGLVFFFLVVLLILKQRIIDRGLRIALWWTRFLPSGDIDLDIMEKGGGVMTTAVAVASSVTTSASLALVGLSQTVSGVLKPSDGATVGGGDPSAVLPSWN